jgi:hypothetical protein
MTHSLDVDCLTGEAIGLAGIVDLVATARAYVDTHRETMAGGQVIMTVRIHLGGDAAERKARADVLAGGNGEWFNGYYRARTIYSDESDDFDLILEVQFDPPIFAGELDAG